MKYVYTLVIAFLLFSVSASAQVQIYKNDFTSGTADLGRLTFNFSKAFKPEAPAEISGATLSIRGNNGGSSVRGYTGYITTTALTFNPGAVYTVTFRARAVAQSAQLRFQRGATAAIAGSTDGTHIAGITPSNTVNRANTDFTNFTVNFTVNSVVTEHLSFYVNSILDVSNNNNEYLYIDEISVTRTCGTIAQPTAASISRCGAGSVSLSATGAPAGGAYRWYSAPTAGTLLSSAATYTISNLANTTTYYVSAVNADGCESARVPVTATINNREFANTEFVRQSYEAGKPGVIKLNSDVIDRKHAASIKWQSVNVVTKVVTDLGVTPAPEASPASFQVGSMPGSDTYFQATIIPIASVCYDESSLFVTSQDIVALPVELVSFKAQSTTDGVQLSWKTASELDNKGFEVEVSADGKNFRKVAFVESKVGTTSLTQHYSFLDTRAVAGTNYYRLKQVDFDGAFEYSKTVAINITLASAATVYPTLATTDITVRLASAEEQVTIAVADMAGKQLLAVQNPAERQVVLPVQQLQQGVYFVTVISGTQKEVIRFVKR